MHDIKAIRDDAGAFTAGLKRRGFVAAESITSDVLARDKELRDLQTRLQQAQAQSLMSEVAGLKDEIQKGEEKERELQADLAQRLEILPNLPAADVPNGVAHNLRVLTL